MEQLTHDSLHDVARTADHVSLVAEQEMPYLGPWTLDILDTHQHFHLPRRERADVEIAIQSMLFV